MDKTHKISTQLSSKQSRQSINLNREMNSRLMKKCTNRCHVYCVYFLGLNDYQFDRNLRNSVSRFKYTNTHHTYVVQNSCYMSM